MRRCEHTQPGPMTLDLDIEAGVVEVITEVREYAEVTVDALLPGDSRAMEIIEGITSSMSGEILTVSAPHSPGTTVVSNSGSRVTQVINGNVVSGASVVGVQVVNGRVIHGNIQGGVVTTVGNEGGLRVTARLPHGSSVRAKTVSAEVTTHHRLHQVDCRTTSGDITIADASEVRATTTSGDIAVNRAESVTANAVSGDMRVFNLDHANLAAVSGDITVHGATNGAVVSASTVSGDITITSPRGVDVRTHTNTVSGRVRTPQQ